MEVVETRVTESVLEANVGNEAQIEYVPYGRLSRRRRRRTCLP